MKRLKTLNTLTKTMLTWLLLVLPSLASAQNGQAVEMADKLRENGKIYVVVIVIFTIFIGIVLFLISLERRLKKLEQSKHS